MPRHGRPASTQPSVRRWFREYGRSLDPEVLVTSDWVEANGEALVRNAIGWIGERV